MHFFFPFFLPFSFMQGQPLFHSQVIIDAFAHSTFEPEGGGC